MKIYTKKGDSGETSLVTGQKVSKSILRLEAYGTVDELNSYLGVIAAHCLKLDFASEYKFITSIQNQLFNIGSQLACDSTEVASQLPQVNTQIVSKMESLIDEMTAGLPDLKNFILPGGSEISAQTHIARTVARRTERICVGLNQISPIPGNILVFLNRLSDYLFMLARFFNHKQKIKDVEWTK